MWASHLSLINFRNYESLEIDFAKGPVLVLGRNGQGKTNLVEAVAYFDSLASHRVSADAPLLRAGQQQSVLRLTTNHAEAARTLELELNQGKAKRAQINGNAVKPIELTRYFTSVVFAPEDLMIVRGDPAERRKFMDQAIVTRTPYFAGILREYDRIVRQRSALLKSVRGNHNAPGLAETLGFWDQQLVDVGTRVMAERRRLIDALAPHLTRTYANLVGAEHDPQLALRESGANVSRETYRPGSLSEPDTSGALVAFDHLGDASRESLMADFRARLDQRRSAEIERGITLIGPHRDDLELSLNGLPVKGYASHGESWSVALGLKLAFAELLRAELAPEDPVLILDDVFAELDANRRARLMAAVGDYEQVIVTAAVAEDIPLTQPWQVHIVAGGRVLRQAVTDDPRALFNEVVGNV